MNLIHDAWIPVRRKSGAKEKIAPWQVTDMYIEDPIVELAAVRSDFNGALIQFLIGLLQTTCAPQGNSAWRKWLNTPPLPEEFKVKFEPVALALNLDGNGPRFMQDLTIEDEAKKTIAEVEKLLIDAPGDQTLKQNKDLFIKRDRIRRMCPTCCAQALLTLQINAPCGGAGHRVGLRGGGPVNTVVLGDNLWQTVWCNVLLENEFNDMAAATKRDSSDKFPWVAKTRTSEKDRITTSQDVHPAQIYWSMPRRIKLITISEAGRCDLCNYNGVMMKEYYTKPYGIKYDGFIHPLTPTYKNKDGIMLAVHQHEMLGYKHWLGYVQNTDGGSEPARVINSAFKRQMADFRIWAFGYDMDNMKACCWYEGVMPVIFIEDERKWKTYGAYVTMLIRAADMVSDILSKTVVKALNAGVFNRVRQRFWQETEVEFYKQIRDLWQEVLDDRDDLSVRQTWHGYLTRKAQEIFNDMSQADMIEIVDAERVSKAWNDLRKNLYGKKLKIEILGLPK